MLERRIALVLVLATVLAYGRVVNCDFVNVDDPSYVVANGEVRRGLTSEGLRWAFSSTEVSLWHPATWLSHMLDVQLYGLDPAGHHLTNLLLHSANVVLVFLVFRTMTGAPWPSAAVAALFALHPLRVESVAWVAERKDVLSAFFGLLAVWAYVGYARRPGPWRYQLVALPFALALMSKPMLVTLPLMLLLLDHWPLRRAEDRWHLVAEKVPLLVLSAGAGIVQLIAAYRTAALGRLPLTTRLANAAAAYAWYVAKAAWPARLAVFYPLPVWPRWEIAAATILVVALSALAASTWRSRPYLGVGWFWFLGMLAPVSGLLQAGSQAVADRFTYLPLIGLFVMLVWGTLEVAARVKLRPSVVAGCAAIVLAACMVRTWTQIGYWRDSAHLFSHALAVTNGNWFAHNNLGDALARRGQLDEAVAEFSEALRILPNYPDAHYNLGVVLAARGQTEEAIDHYTAVLHLDPTYPNAHNNLGNALLVAGRTREAIDELAEALRLRPDGMAHFNLAQALTKDGRLDEAIVHYREAIRLAPNLAQAHTRLAQALMIQGMHSAGGTRPRLQWVLLRPPEVADGSYPKGYRLVLAAPIAQWKSVAAFDTEDVCEAARKKNLQDSIERARAEHGDDAKYDLTVRGAVNAVCVPTERK